MTVALVVLNAIIAASAVPFRFVQPNSTFQVSVLVLKPGTFVFVQSHRSHQHCIKRQEAAVFRR